jgi:hypothetical protein
LRKIDIDGFEVSPDRREEAGGAEAKTHKIFSKLLIKRG